jgi:Family of unknown function (DUF5946)
MGKPTGEFNELLYYTLGHPDKDYFIHQHAVDAFQAQTADEKTKPIGLVFSLIGLYLFLERGYTGKAVQQAHMTMAQHKKTWPSRPLPAERGEITVTEVLKSTPGPERDQMIRCWCVSVWNAYKDWQFTIAVLADSYGLGAK